MNTPLEIQLALMTTAYFLGDFSIIYHLTNRNSFAFRAIESADIHALKKFADRNLIDLHSLNEIQREQYDQCAQQIERRYKEQVTNQPLPLPESYLEELGDRAVSLANFSTAHSAFAASNRLERKVNELIVKGVESLQSRDVKSSTEEGGEALEVKVKESVTFFYHAMRIKNPLGNQFQYLSASLYGESMRKYIKFVELSLLKEIIEFGIEYLIDDKAISNRIVENLGSGKVRKLFLKYLAQTFSLDEEKYRSFIDRHKKAAEMFKAVKSDHDISEIPKVMLGRRTGDNESYQYLKELSVEHPIAALLTVITTTPENNSFLVPILMKSGISLVEFLELGAVSKVAPTRTLSGVEGC